MHVDAHDFGHDVLVVGMPCGIWDALAVIVVGHA